MPDSSKTEDAPYTRTVIMKPRQIDVLRTRLLEIAKQTRKARRQKIFNKRRIDIWQSANLDAQPAQLQKSEKKDTIADINSRNILASKTILMRHY